MITKRYEQKLEALEDGRIQCRLSTVVVKTDGTELPPKFHRHVVDVGDDLTNQSARVKAVAPLIWTQAVRDARAAFKADPEAVLRPVVPGTVEKTCTVNHVLPNGAIVAQVCDILEEDGIEIGREYRPNRLVDVEADTSGESEQIRGLALGTWTQDVKGAANSRRAAVIAESEGREKARVAAGRVKGGAMTPETAQGVVNKEREKVATAQAKAKHDTDIVSGNAARVEG